MRETLKRQEQSKVLTRVVIHNYRSILDADIKLQPFTLLIGANGSGKSNFLKLLNDISVQTTRLEKHLNHKPENTKVSFYNESGQRTEIYDNSLYHGNLFPEISRVMICTLHPNSAGASEELSGNPQVDPVGRGVIRVLDSLKTGDREDLFHTIEAKLKEYIPEVEKLSFIPGGQNKRLQVRERHIKDPILASELSDGTRLVLMILTILYQEHPPSLICFEDIDHGIHPRLLQKVIELCFDLAGKEGRPQMIATTHNPYVVDLFKGHEDAVILVEKENGYTRFITLEERLEKMKEVENPLGELWYSGFVGGVPVEGKE